MRGGIRPGTWRSRRLPCPSLGRSRRTEHDWEAAGFPMQISLTWESNPKPKD
jgi:hypothetical protein